MVHHFRRLVKRNPRGVRENAAEFLRPVVVGMPRSMVDCQRLYGVHNHGYLSLPTYAYTQKHTQTRAHTHTQRRFPLPIVILLLLYCVEQSFHGSQIPREPSYLLLNTAISNTWGFPVCSQSCACDCWDASDDACGCAVDSGLFSVFPAEFVVDWVSLFCFCCPCFLYAGKPWSQSR